MELFIILSVVSFGCAVFFVKKMVQRWLGTEEETQIDSLLNAPIVVLGSLVLAVGSFISMLVFMPKTPMQQYWPLVLFLSLLLLAIASLGIPKIKQAMSKANKKILEGEVLAMAISLLISFGFFSVMTVSLIWG